MLKYLLPSVMLMSVAYLGAEEVQVTCEEGQVYDGELKMCVIDVKAQETPAVMPAEEEKAPVVAPDEGNANDATGDEPVIKEDETPKKVDEDSGDHSEHEDHEDEESDD